MPTRLPRPCYHKGRHRWYVTLDGRERYLLGELPPSRSPPPEVRAEYDLVLSNWLAARAAAPVEVGTDPSMAELCKAYLAHAATHYVKNGRRTAEVACIDYALRPIVASLYRDLPARLFSPKKLAAIREAYVELGWERNYINQQVSRVRRMFRWGVAEEAVEESVWRALQAVADIAPHKGIREARKIIAVDDEDLQAVALWLPPGLANLVRFHRAIGCRADEATLARPCDFVRQADPESPTGEMWLYTPSSSKTDATYWAGPLAQLVTLPLIEAAASTDAWLFPTGRTRGGGNWKTASYRRAVLAACNRLNVHLDKQREENPLPPVRWHPLQVRHAAGEEARRSHPKGLEATQARLRHKEMSVSQKYAHDLTQLGKEVARQLG